MEKKEPQKLDYKQYWDSRKHCGNMTHSECEQEFDFLMDINSQILSPEDDQDRSLRMRELRQRIDELNPSIEE